jgi:hypothetical protein
MEIFSGERSRDMWEMINDLKTGELRDQLHDLLYLIGCRLQELETKVDSKQDKEPKL